MSLLSVNFMGLPLKNPIIAAAGPWCRDAAAMQKAIDAGAAAVVTETITLEKSHVVSPRIFYRQGEVYNTTLYSTMTLEDVEQEVERLQKGNAFLICNIRGTTPSELRYLASRMQRLGADALELCCFTPIGTKLEDISIRPEEVGEMVRSVTSAVEIPVMVRLPHHAALNPAFARQITQNGARAISAIESLEGINGVDIENARCEMAAIGGCTGSHLRPLSLAATAVLHQLADCEIAAMCGVEDWHSIIEFLMMGATAVEMGSAIMLRGYGHITETLRKLEDWLREKGYSSLDELRGNALASLTAFEELPERLLRVKMGRSLRWHLPRWLPSTLCRRLPVRCHFSGDGGHHRRCRRLQRLRPMRLPLPQKALHYEVNSSRRAAALRLLFDMNVTINKCYIKKLSIPLKYWRKRKKLLKF